MRVGAAPEMTYEEIVGGPEELSRDADRLSFGQGRWKRLRAYCKYGTHFELIGHFQRPTDWIQLPNGAGTSFASWRELERAPYLKGMVWHCETCGKDTQHRPRGWVWA